MHTQIAHGTRTLYCLSNSQGYDTRTLDCCSNSFRVVKTVKQTASDQLSYKDAISGILKTDGVQVATLVPCPCPTDTITD